MIRVGIHGYCGGCTIWELMLLLWKVLSLDSYWSIEIIASLGSILALSESITTTLFKATVNLSRSGVSKSSTDQWKRSLRSTNLVFILSELNSSKKRRLFPRPPWHHQCSTTSLCIFSDMFAWAQTRVFCWVPCPGVSERVAEETIGRQPISGFQLCASGLQRGTAWLCLSFLHRRWSVSRL